MTKKIKKAIKRVSTYFSHKIELVYLLIKWLFFSKMIVLQELNSIGHVKYIKHININKWHNGTSSHFAEMSDDRRFYIKISNSSESIQSEIESIKLLENVSYKYGYKVCKIFKSFISNKCNFVIEEYIIGIQLSNKTLVNSMSIQKKIHVTETIRDIIDSFYSIHFIHSDLTPKNILLANNGDIYIIDFEFSIFPTRNIETIRKSELRKMQKVGGNYCMKNNIIDDCYSALLICKYLIPDLQVLNHEIWYDLNRKIGRIQFDLSDKMLQIQKNERDN